MSEPTTKIEIFNQTYNIRHDGDDTYIQELGAYVDQKMREVSSGTYTVDSQKVAILAALHIADEYHQLKLQQTQTDNELARRSLECTEELDQLFKGKASGSSIL